MVKQRTCRYPSEFDGITIFTGKLFKMPTDGVLKGTVLLFNAVISQWKLPSSMTLEFPSHHITDS